jgi:hypothetical protein
MWKFSRSHECIHRKLIIAEINPKFLIVNDRIMEILKSNPKGYPGNHMKVQIDDPNLDLEKAKTVARQKAQEICDDPMLLSWYCGKTGESYPNLECGPGDKPAWITYAESRGGDITVDINKGQFVFIYLSI